MNWGAPIIAAIMSNSWEDSRWLCEYCHQYLAASGYYLHLNDKLGSICPGKSLDVSEPLEQSAEELLSNHENIRNISIATESSFHFESSEEQFLRNEPWPVEDDIDIAQDAPANKDESIVSDSSSDFSFQLDLDEIWEDSDLCRCILQHYITKFIMYMYIKSPSISLLVSLC